MRRGAALLLLFAACAGATERDATVDAEVVDANVDAAVDAGEPEDAAPARLALSETGLYAASSTIALAADVVAYDVRYELWSDGAEKRRYLFLPRGTRIDNRDPDGWTFPVGTKAWKEFIVAGRLVETRLLEKRAEGEDGWTLVAFAWSEDGSDAFAEPLGVAGALGTHHDIPSSEDCVKCHRGAADVLIGLSAFQLTSTSAAALIAADRFVEPPVLADPPGDGAVRDALGYLHGNCGHCHNDRHPLAEHETLRLALPVAVTRAEDTPAYRTSICVPALHMIENATTAVAPKDPEGSQLYVRMRVRGDVQMPPLATELPDDAGLAIVAAWIDGLDPCAR